MKQIHTGQDGRKWRQEGPTFWHCYEDGTVIQSLDEILPSGETAAEANFRKFIEDSKPSLWERIVDRFRGEIRCSPPWS
jgi:hypothetical protein